MINVIYNTVSTLFFFKSFIEFYVKITTHVNYSLIMNDWMFSYNIIQTRKIGQHKIVWTEKLKWKRSFFKKTSSNKSMYVRTVLTVMREQISLFSQEKLKKNVRYRTVQKFAKISMFRPTSYQFCSTYRTVPYHNFLENIW